jgi:MoaA/NifB/PqqE/SkfB family radical SAM enzyme
MQTKCAAFWQHTNVRSDNRVFPCCRFKQPIQSFDGDLEKILHTNEYNALREQSLAGIPIAGCEKCYYEEAMGKESLREQFNRDYDCDTVELKFLEIGFDNICNLACDGCWGEFSSTWAKKENPNVIHIKTTDEITVVPDTINKILFLGGEPLMTKRHLKFLKLVKNKKDTSVTYNTNGTFMLNTETQELLRQFKSVKFIVSVDGFGKLNNKVRSGSHWSDIVDFIYQIRKTSFELVIHSVIHINNWHGLADLSNFVSNVGVEWTVNVLTYPPHLNVVNLKDKTELIQLISNINIPNKDYILNHIKGPYDNI